LGIITDFGMRIKKKEYVRVSGYGQKDRMRLYISKQSDGETE